MTVSARCVQVYKTKLCSHFDKPSGCPVSAFTTRQPHRDDCCAVACCWLIAVSSVSCAVVVLQRGSYCSFAHGKSELRHKNRKFADLSCKELNAPIIQLSHSHGGDSRNDAAFAHFRQRARAQLPQPVRREAETNAASYGFGDRERRYSAPDRILRERITEQGGSGRRTSDDDIDERIKVKRRNTQPAALNGSAPSASSLTPECECVSLCSIV